MKIRGSWLTFLRFEQGPGSAAKATPTKSRGPVKNQPFDEAVDLSASDTSISHVLSATKGDRYGGVDTSLDSMSEAKEVKGRPPAGGAKAAAVAAKGDKGVLKDRPFDEEHSLGDDSGDLSSEESVMTNGSEPKPRAAATSAKPASVPASAAAAAAPKLTTQGTSCGRRTKRTFPFAAV
jgi:hypothetical protein